MIIPVMSATGRVVHVMESEDNHGWVEGHEGVSVCGRTLNWYLVEDVTVGERPCKKCDELSNVLIAIFDVEQKMEEAREYLQHHHDPDDQHFALRNRVDQAGWLQYGMMRGFISPPDCFSHEGMLITSWEQEHFDAEGEYPCMHYVRFFPAP